MFFIYIFAILIWIVNFSLNIMYFVPRTIAVARPAIIVAIYRKHLFQGSFTLSLSLFTHAHLLRSLHHFAASDAA